MAAVDTQGQPHDRIELLRQQQEHGGPPAPNFSAPRGAAEGEITAVQRMMSATIGSVLTSLLGTLLHEIYRQKHILTTSQ